MRTPNSKLESLSYGYYALSKKITRANEKYILSYTIGLLFFGLPTTSPLLPLSAAGLLKLLILQNSHTFRFEIAT